MCGPKSRSGPQTSKSIITSTDTCQVQNKSRKESAISRISCTATVAPTPFDYSFVPIPFRTYRRSTCSGSKQVELACFCCHVGRSGNSRLYLVVVASTSHTFTQLEPPWVNDLDRQVRGVPRLFRTHLCMWLYARRVLSIRTRADIHSMIAAYT